jgi:hypothetical protein
MARWIISIFCAAVFLGMSVLCGMIAVAQGATISHFLYLYLLTLAGLAVAITSFLFLIALFLWDKQRSPWHQETLPDGKKVWVRRSSSWFWFIRF